MHKKILRYILFNEQTKYSAKIFLIKEWITS